LIEIESKGGNIRQFLDYYQKVQLPVKDIDLDTESEQVRIVSHFQKMKGRDDEEISIMIDGLKQKGALKNYAEKARDYLEEDQTKRIAEAKNRAVEEEKHAREYLANYRKEFASNLKNGFELTDSKRKNLTDLSVRQDADGNFEIYKIFADVWRDPKKAVELVYFLTDREGYLTQASNRKVLDEKGKIMRILTRTKKDRSSSARGDDDKDKGNKDIEIDIDRQD
jgi:hypothetical protein